MTVLVTGVPGVSKTSVCAALAQHRPDRYRHVSFGSFIAQALGGEVSEFELRQHPVALVTRTTLERATRLLFRELVEVDEGGAVALVDSHAVSQDWFGLIATPDGPSYFDQVKYEAVLHLTASASDVLGRSDPAVSGRQAKTVEDVARHDQLQLAVSVNYAAACECPLLVIDASGSFENVVSHVEGILKLLDERG